MELPSHPESEDTTPHRQPAATTSRATVIVVVIIGVLLATVLILHLTGVVGPGASTAARTKATRRGAGCRPG